MKLIESDADVQEGMAALALIDPRLAPIIDRVGPVPLRRHAPGFHGLAAIIISQQVSVASAKAIEARTLQVLGTISPETIRAADEATLRSCGLSGPKMRTLRAMAEAVHAGELPIDELHRMPIDEAMARLTAVKGIGPWTAEIYMMFYAGHADVIASGDLALQEAVRLAFGLERRPSAQAFAEMAAQWSPWRSVAARLLWGYYMMVKSRDGVAG